MSNPEQRPVICITWWTTAQEAYLRKAYPDTPMAQLVSALQRSATAIQKRAEVLGVKRSAAFLASEHGGRLRPGTTRGMATRFKRKAVSE